MSSTSLKIYSTRDLVGGMCWTGSSAAYGAIKHWAGDFIDKDGEGNVWLTTDEGAEPLKVGNHILLVNGSFFQFTPDELEENYVEVQEDV